MFVYVIVNDVSLKIYVGKTTSFNLVKYLQSKISDALGRRYHGRSHLLASIRKYGREHFHIYPLFEGVTNEELCIYEQLLIKALKAQHPDIGYNICRGGQGRTDKGWHHTPETRAKQSASNRGKHRKRLMSPENQAKRIAAWEESLKEHDGSFHKDGTVEKIKEARAQQDEVFRIEKQKEYERLHPERRQKAAATHRGTKHEMSFEGSQAISEAFKRASTKHWASPSQSLVSQRFGRLVVQAEAGRTANAKRHRLWECACDCGGAKIATTSLLRDGKVRSCGCLARESRAANGRSKLAKLREQPDLQTL